VLAVAGVLSIAAPAAVHADPWDNGYSSQGSREGEWRGDGDDLPWRGQVVKYDAGLVWANVGGEGGVSIGDRMSLERVDESLTDPATGEVLKESHVELGVVTITNVEPKIAWGSYQASVTGDPARGDFLVLQPH
jgi:hypothetical protein